LASFASTDAPDPGAGSMPYVLLTAGESALFTNQRNHEANKRKQVCSMKFWQGAMMPPFGAFTLFGARLGTVGYK
jgi:hypothetical protein